MRDIPASCTIVQRELEALLEIAHLSPLAASPLQGTLDGSSRASVRVVRAPGAELEPALVQTLADGGWLETTTPPRLRPRCQEALSILASPHRSVRLTLGSQEGLVGMDLYADAASPDRWVRLQSEGTAAWGRMEFFLSAQTLVERVAGAMTLDATFLSPSFTVCWTWERYLVLLGMLDVFRAAALASILERRDPPEVAMSGEDILSAFKQGLARKHYYWAVSLGTLISPGDMNISKARIDAILEELAGEGFVARTTHGTFRLRRGLQELAISLLLIPSFLAASLRVLQGSAHVPRLHVAAIRGANSLWLLEFFENGGGVQVSVEACQGQDLADLVREMLVAPAPAVEARETKPMPVEEAR